MILAAHQPNYLPYIGFFHKAMMCDVFVIADHVQYTKKEWQNRNKIRTKCGCIWLTVPVISKNHFQQRIGEVNIDNSVNWADTHWKSIFYNYVKAPFFGSYKKFFKEIYSQKWEKLLDLNEAIIYHILKELNIKAKVVKSSTLNLEGSKTDLLVGMCKKMNADTYISGIGAKNYIEEEPFKNENIKLLFQDFCHSVYPQRFDSFIPNMSVIDLLFNVGSDKAREIISKSSGIQ